MDMQIIAVNVGTPEHIPGYRPLTGINKRLVSGPVEIGPLGLAGDAILDRQNHGGPDQAVYLYGVPDYQFFAAELGRPLTAGLFGENLTVTNLFSQHFNIGDRLQIGEVLLEVSAPRNPCATFAAWMDDPGWVKRFFAARRPGLYARVLQGGPIEAGMRIAVTPFAGTAVPVTELMHDYKKPSRERMKYLLGAPIHRDLVEQYEAMLGQGDLLD